MILKIRIIVLLLIIGSTGALLFSEASYAMEPPTKEEIQQYKDNGTFNERIDRAYEIGNDKTDPFLYNNLRNKLNTNETKNQTPPSDWQGGLPSKGNVKVPVLLIDFNDYPHTTSQTVADVSSKFFGNGDSSTYPYESLKNFYLRSSYGQLNISGDVLGWYRAQYNRNYYLNLGDGPGQEALIKEAILYYDSMGQNFSVYDNDNNGFIDALFVKWTGPDNGWSGFWWAYQWSWHATPNITVDGKQIGKYDWSWYSRPDGGTYYPRVDIHETGHLLGLPDLYDYDGNIGPDGGVGGLDMMDSNWGDLNCFFKFLLGWINPTIISSGNQLITLNPSGTSTDAVMIMPGTTGNIFGEYFMAQYRKKGTGNDPLNYQGPNDGYPRDYPADGLIIWHIDATLNSTGTNFSYDNSYTSHKLLRLMEADGLEEIEQYSALANAGDFFTPPKTFGPSTSPNSQNYSGVSTNVQIYNLTTPGNSISAEFTTTSSLNVSGIDPGSSAVDIPLSKAITINFNKTVQAASGYNNISVNSSSGPAIITKNITNNQLTITPTNNWTPGTSYTVNIPYNAVMDTNGNGLTANYTSSFTTLTLPAVTYVDPANNSSNNPLSKAITITFNKTVQAGTGYNNISVTSSSGPAIITKNITNNQLTITPTNNWTPTTTYTINLPQNAVTDSNGNILTSNFASTFITGSSSSELSVTSIDPANNAVNVSTYKQIMITFNKPIRMGSAYNNLNITRTSGGIKTTYKYIVGNSIYILPANGWDYLNTFNINIPYNAVTDMSGNTLSSNYTSSFSTFSPITINSIDPTNGAVNISLSKTIAIIFNKTVQAGTGYNNISVTSSSGPAIITKNITNNQLTITPTNNWTPGTSYTVNIPNDALRDSSGNVLASNFSSSFSTLQGFYITNTDPSSGAVDVSLTKLITITFNKNIASGADYNNISVTSSSGTVGITKNITNNQLTITPTNNWTPETSYNINIPYNAVIDAGGNTLTTNYTSSFTTLTLPAVTSVDPANNSSNNPLSKAITITFNKTVQAGTGYNNISVTSSSGPAIITKNITNNQLTITPTNNWTPTTTYTINLPQNAVTDSSGNNLTSNFTSTFSTSQELTITNTDPAGGAVDIPLSKAIIITFNKPIQTGSAYNNISVTSSYGPAIITKNITNNQLTITPTNNWTPGTSYTVNIPYNAVIDTNGNGLTANYTSSFTTLTLPAVTSVDPAGGAVDIPLSKIITINFNKTVQAGTGYNNISVTSSSGPASITKNITNNQLTITPTNNWTPGTSYTVNIPYNAVIDTNGNGLTANYTSSFTTLTLPAVTSVDPANNSSNNPLSKAITINFNKTVQAGTGYNNISVTSSSGPAIITKNITNNQLTITPTNNWTPTTTYTINLPQNAVTDANGNTLNANYTSTFTTISSSTFTVTSTNPSNNAVNVPTYTQIIITFNKPIRMGSAYNNLTVTKASGSIKTTYKYITGNSIYILPANGWDYLTTFTVNLPYNAVTDTNGNTLNANYSFSFTAK